jgi:hypothetical protein
LGTGEVDLQRDLSAYSPDTASFERLCGWLNAPEFGPQVARRTEADSPLLVGNDPLIGWLASKLSGRPTPVARGELICLARDPRRRRVFQAGTRVGGERWRLSWTISEDGEAETEAIRVKIRSKMNTAAALGTVIVGLTSFLLQDAVQEAPSSKWQWWAFGALGASAMLYFATLFLYDTLLMPSRFWASRFPPKRRTRKGPASVWARFRYGKASVLRPPTSMARVLQANMVQIWTWIFQPATVLVFVGVALFALGATSDNGSAPNVQLWYVSVAIVGIVIVVVAWVAWQRPNLGASD